MSGFITALRELKRGKMPLRANGQLMVENDEVFDHILDLADEEGLDITANDDEASRLVASLLDPELASMLTLLIMDLGGSFNGDTPHGEVRSILAAYRAKWLEFLGAWLELQPLQQFSDDPQFSALVFNDGSPYVTEQLSRDAFLFHQFVRHFFRGVCQEKVAPSYLDTTLNRVIYPSAYGGHEQHCLLFFQRGQPVGFCVWKSDGDCDFINLFCSQQKLGRHLFKAYFAEAGYPRCIALKSIEESIGFYSRMGFRHIAECGLSEPSRVNELRKEVESDREGWKSVSQEYYDRLKRMQPGIKEDEGYFMLKCADGDRDGSDEGVQRKRHKSDTE